MPIIGLHLLLLSALAQQPADKPAGVPVVPGDTPEGAPVEAPPGAPGGAPVAGPDGQPLGELVEGRVPGEPVEGAGEPAEGAGEPAEGAGEPAEGAGGPAGGAVPTAGEVQPSPGSGARPFMLVVADQSRNLSGEPTVEICNGEVVLSPRDDGRPPDVQPGDHIWSIVTSTCPADQPGIRLLVNGEEYWSGEIEYPSDQSSPSVQLFITPDGVNVEVSSDGPDAGLDAGLGTGGDAVVTPGGAASAPGAGGVSAPGAGGVSSGGGGAPWWMIAGGLLVGAAAGFGAARVLSGRAGGGIQRVGRPSAPSLPAPLPAPEGPGQIWSLPDAEARAEVARWLAIRLSGRGPVLLVPDPARRGEHEAALEGRGGIYWLRDEVLELDALVAAARRLSASGPVSVIVEGAGALEAPLKGEAPDAVLRDLVGDEKVGFVIALAGPETALSEPAAVTLEWLAGGLGIGGRVLIALGRAEE